MTIMQEPSNMYSFNCGPQNPVPEIDLEKADSLAAKTSPVLLESLAAEIASIIEGGVNIRSLMELSKFAHVAQELLMVRTPLAEVRRKSRPRGFGALQSGSFYDVNSPTSVSSYQSMYNEDLQPLTNEAAHNETFGAKITKELVSAIGAMRRNVGPSIQDLIDGIKQAKDAGLESVAEKLEAKLEEALGGDSAMDDGDSVEAVLVEKSDHCDNCEGCETHLNGGQISGESEAIHAGGQMQ